MEQLCLSWAQRVSEGGACCTACWRQDAGNLGEFESFVKSLLSLLVSILSRLANQGSLKTGLCDQDWESPYLTLSWFSKVCMWEYHLGGQGFGGHHCIFMPKVHFIFLVFHE